MDDFLPILSISASSVLIGALATKLLTRSPKTIEPVQLVAHRIQVPNVDLARENKKLSDLLPRAEKERDYWKQEAQRWMPRPMTMAMVDSDPDINLVEAKDWLN